MIRNVSGIICKQDFAVLLRRLGRFIVLLMSWRTVTLWRVVVLLVTGRSLGWWVVTGRRMTIATVVVVVTVTEFPSWRMVTVIGGVIGRRELVRRRPLVLVLRRRRHRVVLGRGQVPEGVGTVVGVLKLGRRVFGGKRASWERVTVLGDDARRRHVNRTSCIQGVPVRSDKSHWPRR